ncbi:MAG TPA: hypothetical protein P5201_02390, partial [Aminobacteriaceae bacterium]|nr:hypothetical protein [Aminobacteriaceae bacterium]
MLEMLKKALGLDPNERALKRYTSVVEQINALEPALLSLSDEELREKGASFNNPAMSSFEKPLSDNL